MGNKLHINWSTYNELCEKLILKIAKSGYEIDLIIAIMRGGAIPADLVSRVLKKDTAYLCAKSYSGEKTEDIQGEEMPMRVLIPAFMISELRRAFEIGFLIFES